MWRVRLARVPVATSVLVGVLLGAASAGASTHFTVSLASASHGQAKSTTPAAPTSVTLSCDSSTTVKLTVSWGAATHATGYTIYESKTSGSYSSVATVTTTSWTSGSLNSGKYAFEVSTSIGSKWTSAESSATSSRTITASNKTCGPKPTATQVTDVHLTGGSAKTFTTATFTMTSGDAYLIFAARTPDSGDSVTAITSTGFTTAPTFALVTATTYNSAADSEWAYYATGGVGTGKVKITFTKANNTGVDSTGKKQTYVEVAQLAGQGTPPIVTTNEGFNTGTGTTVSDKLPNAPGVGNGEVVFFSANGAVTAPTSTPAGLTKLATTSTDHSAGSIAIYYTQSASITTYKFTIPNHAWGAMAFDIPPA